MKLKDEEAWKKWQQNNTDPYGGACIMVARRAMELMDDMEVGPGFDAYALISRADEESGAGGITGYMAGAVAAMISQCHENGEAFRRAWNKETQIGTEGDKANESGGVLNPALLNIG